MPPLNIEPRLEPLPFPVIEFCARCGEIAGYANNIAAYCSECVSYLADDMFQRMTFDDKAEWAGFGVI